MKTFARILRGLVAASLLATAGVVSSAAPAAASHSATHTRCTALVTQINQERTRRDLRIMYALCIIGRERTAKFAAANRAWHDIDYAIRRLREMGFSYRWGGDFCGIGEVIGWTEWRFSTWSGYANRFANLWHASPPHWAVINGASYTRGGGSMRHDGIRTYAAFYAIDTSC